MPAPSRIAERAPSAATTSRACSTVPSANSTAAPSLSGLTLRTADDAQIDAAGFGLLGQHFDQIAVLDHMGERLARLDIAGEGEKDRPHRVAELAVGDHHVEDRLRLFGDVVPDADRGIEPPRAGNDRGGALVLGVIRDQRRIGDRHRKRRPERLAQRNSKRQAGKAAARDQHIDSVPGHDTIILARPPARQPYPCPDRLF